MFADSGEKAETVYSQRKVTWSLLPSEKVAAERPDEASVCWLPRLARAARGGGKDAGKPERLEKIFSARILNFL